MARLENMMFPQGLTLEDRVRMGVRAAKFEMDPAYVEILKKLAPGVRVRQAFALWDMAWGALYRQGIKRGLSPEEAKQEAARRMLATKNDV
jgi:hypothetical protein